MQPVYAPKYPLFAEEGWWVLVGDLNRKTIFSFERITDNGRVVSKEVRCVDYVVSCLAVCCVVYLMFVYKLMATRAWFSMYLVSSSMWMQFTAIEHSFSFLF